MRVSIDFPTSCDCAKNLIRRLTRIYRNFWQNHSVNGNRNMNTESKFKQGMWNCTAIENSDHPLNQECATIIIYLKGASDGEPNVNEEPSLPRLKRKSLLRHSAARVHKLNCVVAITSAKISSRSENSSSLKMRRKPCLAPRISHLARRKLSGLPSLSSALSS